MLADQLHAVRQPAEAVERASRRRGRHRPRARLRPPPARWPCRAGAPDDGTAPSDARRTDELGPARRRSRRAPAARSERVRPRPGASAARRSATGSSRLTTRSPVASGGAKSSAFACAYASERAVPVEVVVGDVEQHRDVGREGVGGERELERRHLGDDHVDVVAGGVEQRSADVAGGRRSRCPTPSSIASISVVTVVLPLVPVTATRRGPSGGAQALGREVDLAIAPARRRSCAATIAG